MMSIELGLTPQALDELPEALVRKLVIYQQIKNVAMYGGNWQP